MKSRIDRWLWAARFFKTRALAAAAVDGGRVHLAGARTKPAKELREGDELEITIGPVTRTVIVRGLSVRRGPASEAALLYEETPESRERREREAHERRLSPPPGAGEGRPDKRERRRIDALRGRRRGPSS